MRDGAVAGIKCRTKLAIIRRRTLIKMLACILKKVNWMSMWTS